MAVREHHVGAGAVKAVHLVIVGAVDGAIARLLAAGDVVTIHVDLRAGIRPVLAVPLVEVSFPMTHV